VDRVDDGVFRADVSLWGNVFSNQTALFRTSDGGMCRINEFRRVGWAQQPGWPEVRTSMYGTEGSFEEQANARVWVSRNPAGMEDVGELLACGHRDAVASARRERPGEERPFLGLSALHPVARLPDAFRGLPNGHEGSHQFLVVDFVEACVTGRMPPNNVWAAARYCVPGIVAHHSAQRDGESLAIPDFGEPPA
jgi:hypothetical protein